MDPQTVRFIRCSGEVMRPGGNNRVARGITPLQVFSDIPQSPQASVREGGLVLKVDL